jgi:hypothetical protein
MLSASAKQTVGGALVFLGVLWFLASGPLNGAQCGGTVCRSVSIHRRALIGATVTSGIGLASLWSSADAARPWVAISSGVLAVLAGAALAYLFANYYVRFVSPIPFRPRVVLAHLDFVAFAAAGLLIAGVGARSVRRGARSRAVRAG